MNNLKDVIAAFYLELVANFPACYVVDFNLTAIIFLVAGIAVNEGRRLWFRRDVGNDDRRPTAFIIVSRLGSTVSSGGDVPNSVGNVDRNSLKVRGIRSGKTDGVIRGTGLAKLCERAATHEDSVRLHADREFFNKLIE